MGPRQSSVAHFDSAAAEWRDVYEDETLDGTIYRDRMAAAAAWVDQEPALPGARALDIGSGAGLMTTALARRGYGVDAIDTSSAMVDLTIARAAEEGLGRSVSAQVADIHDLPFAEGSFDLLVALGVLPWIDDSAGALREVARVLRPGGRTILSVDSRARLNFLLEPRLNPFLHRVRQARNYVRRRGKPPAAIRVHCHWPSTLDRYVSAAHLEAVAERSLGFGPFTLTGRRLFDDATGRRLHRRLQSLSDRGVPGLRGTGSHYLVLARKPGSRAS